VTQEFEELIRAFNIDLSVMKPLYENIADQIPFPPGASKVTTGKSNIDGIGMFSTIPIKMGETIAPARIKTQRTPAGRYTNHSNNPNAEMVIQGNDIMLVACQHIPESAEVFVDYRQVWLTVLR
jgi:SET domain